MKKSKVFVLTLPGDDARRAPLLSELERQGIDYELFFGINGRNGLSPEHEKMVDRAAAEQVMRRVLTNGEFACALSHRAIYERVLAEGLDAAMVLEDDALLRPDLGDFVRAGGLYAAPMILLDYSRVSVSRVSGKPFQGFGRLWRVVVTPMLATGYVVSASAARALLKRTTPIQAVADWPGDIYELKAYALSPRLVDHLPEGNDLSHLAAGRAINKPRSIVKSRFRYFTSTYWRGYLRRRLSMRIDP